MKIQSLSVIAIICLILVIWIDFFPKYHIPTWASIDSNQLNKLMETIAIAYITSYIFYYLVVFSKEQKDRNIILPYIANHTYFLINQIRFFVYGLKSEAGLTNGRLNMDNELFTTKDYPTQTEWIEIAKINPNTWSEPEGTRLNDAFVRIPTYLGDINQKVSNVEYRISKILTKMQYIEPIYIKILSDIQDNKFHRYILSKGDYRRDVIKSPYDNMELMIEDIKEYFESIKALEIYANENLKKFIDNKHLLV